MKRSIVASAVIVAFAVAGTAFAQLKTRVEEKPKVSESIVRPVGSGSFLGLFTPANFSMRHSYSFSYMLMSGRTLGVGMYTNSMFYKVSDPLNLRLDVSMMHTPFGSNSKQFYNNLKKIFINRAELNYRPSEKLFIQFQFRQLPFDPYWGYYSPYNSVYTGYDFYR